MNQLWTLYSKNKHKRAKYLNPNFLQQCPPLLSSKFWVWITFVWVLDFGQIKEQVETLDEGRGEGGSGHTVDQGLVSTGQQIEGGQQYPAIAGGLWRVHLQESDYGTAGCFCK